MLFGERNRKERRGSVHEAALRSHQAVQWKHVFRCNSVESIPFWLQRCELQGDPSPRKKKNIASCCEEDEMNSTFGETQPDVTLRWPIICWSDSQQVNSLSLMLHLWSLGSVLCSSLKHAVTTCLASWWFTVVLNLLMLCVSANWSAEVPNMSHTRTKEWHAACFGLNVPFKVDN